MTTHAAKNAAGSANPASTPASQFVDFVGAVQYTDSESNVPQTNGDPVTSNHSADNVDHSVGVADPFVTEESSNGSSDHLGYSLTDDSQQSAGASGDVHSIDQQHSITSPIDFVDPQGTSDGLSSDTQYSSFSDGLNSDHLSRLFDHTDSLNFDHIDNPATGFASSTVTEAFSAPTDHSFDMPPADPISSPDAFSFAKGGSHGGGPGGGGGGGGGGHHGGGGSTAPADYTTNSGTGVDFHVTYDSSVGSAPTGFTSVVDQVADFFANSLSDTQHITINIAVGYGEVAGTHMPLGALGESATNLQEVSYSDLVSAYAPTGLSLGSSIPTGNLYVSYAQAKALGIGITSPQTVDGYVGFSSQSGIFDFNNADGVSSNQYDFYGTVAHEFSEVLGRILLVGTNINNAPSYMAYDFFHFLSPGTQDFSGNGGYFSMDQGATTLANFNDPSAPLGGGDAGDWAQGGTVDSTYDAFNAAGTAGQIAPVTHTDMLALQAAGYDMHLALVS